MDTTRSQKMAGDFLARNRPFKRKTLIFRHLFHAPPNILFPQLCPAREADWIDGWTADLIWTTTGYVEPDCIFTTPPENSIGPGLWIFTRLEPDSLLELVRVIDNNMVEHVHIEVEDHGDGTCTGTWTLKFTALNERGNEAIEALPDTDPGFDEVLDGLDRFVSDGHAQRL